MTDDIDARRAEAKLYRGVWYDPRSGKFSAEVYSLGQRHFLGHFDTALAASEAYTEARVRLPSGAIREDTFARALAHFLETAEMNTTHKYPQPCEDEIMLYAGQEFIFRGLTFRRVGRGQRPFYAWTSTCGVCGTLYDTLTGTNPDTAKGITRNCEEHRQGAKARAPELVTASAADPRWVANAAAVADAMSLLSPDCSLEDFLHECRNREPDAPRAFNRWLLTDPASPVELRSDGRLHFR